MAIEFVGGAIAAKAGATSGDTTIALNSGLTGGIASAVAAGDFVLAVFSTGSSADRTLAITDGTSPYNLIGSELFADDASCTNLRVAYKFMGGSPDTATTFGPTGSNNDGGAMSVYVFRGVDPTTPLDVAAVPATGINTLIANPGAITPVTAGAYIAAVGAGATKANVVTYTSSDLTDFMTIHSPDSEGSVLGIGHKPDWVSGAFDPAVFGISGSDSVNFSWCAMTIALRPAVTVAGDTGGFFQVF